jgi:hypothetical protein
MGCLIHHKVQGWQWCGADAFMDAQIGDWPRDLYCILAGRDTFDWFGRPARFASWPALQAAV